MSNSTRNLGFSILSFGIGFFFLVFSVCVVTGESTDQYAVTKRSRENPPMAGTIGKLYCERIYRGSNDVYHLLKVDWDEDGLFDYVQQTFRIFDADVLDLAGSKTMPTLLFHGTNDINVMIRDVDDDGTNDTIMIFTREFDLIELYKANSERLFVPVSAGEFLKAKTDCSTEAPFANAALGFMRNALKSAKQKEKGRIGVRP